MAVIDRREDTNHGDGIDLSAHPFACISDGDLIERRKWSPVHLKAAVNDVRVIADRRTEIGGPAFQRGNGCSCGPSEPQNTDPSEPSPLHNRVHAVRRAQHGAADASRIDPRRLN